MLTVGGLGGAIRPVAPGRRAGPRRTRGDRLFIACRLPLTAVISLRAKHIGAVAGTTVAGARTTPTTITTTITGSVATAGTSRATGARDRVDPGVEAEDVDQRLPDDLGVDAGAEGVGEPHRADGQDQPLPVITVDLGVLGQEGPCRPLEGEDAGEHVGPRSAQRLEVEPSRPAATARGCGGIRSGCRCAWLG